MAGITNDAVERYMYYTDSDPANAAKADDYLKRAGVRDRVEILKVASRVRVGGLLVTDNVLLSGRVTDSSVHDRDTEAVRLFNEMLYSDDRYCSAIIPLRDGVAIGLRVR